MTRPDAPAGRGRHERRSPVAVLAAEAGIPVLTPGRPREPEFLAALAALEPDCCPVVAYGALVPRVALDVPKQGWVNLHFSLLPAWRGAAPVQAALLHGDEVTGASTFLLAEGLDTGPVYGVVTETVRPARHRRRPAGAAVAAAGPRCSPARWTASRTGRSSRCRSRPRDLAGAEDDRRGRRDRLVGAGAAGRPAGPGVHARTRGLDGVRRGPAQARPRAAGGRRARARAGRAAGRAAAGAGRHRRPRLSSSGRCSRRARSRCRRRTGPAAPGRPPAPTSAASHEAGVAARLCPAAPTTPRRSPPRPATGARLGSAWALSRPRHGRAAGTRLGCRREDADRRPGAPGCRRRAVECRVRARSGSRG